MKSIHLLLIISFAFTVFSGCLSDRGETGVYDNQTETLSYQGEQLTPIAQQRNNAIKGTQYIDRESYRLQVNGLVENPRDFTYEEITGLPQTSKVVDLNCVEGWGFTAKWTGVRIADLFEEVGAMENATTVIFYSADGYSTSLDMNYLLENDIIIAYKLNDVTLPPERGFPLQLVAEGKYGYKWVKWIVRIELSDSPYRGYWEERGYNNIADVGGPAFERRG
ncbi:oxidoreductase [Methanosarcina sp. 2.H.T.1A.6]|uniref:molybdopterin-dependent oxidoreductase n=1 Tax=unclassified Methanosarcina TaxID=2644672 RepID=UPI0006213522|nr:MULTISPECIES: molybdopterin-dependent oxidoreductase [unclassified Methanosarcina]KKG11867.1 oxidoreductase [Methanosarcina sp. 2.H.T.1A.15]KKG15860.1 oxidoreductase [Methanosarcina sp. 2.H.T.1A.3]KKG20250.1 oxidoreductase [Methanosarcina sp. 2.H.T.1A.6]KKG26708.1 oxidoreductase [Methanosarcina sp. 2.H.T.1A.8]